MKDNEQEIILLLNSKRFQRRISELRSRWDIPSNGFNNNAELYARREKLSEEQEEELTRDIYEVINNFKQLSERWFEGLRWYIYTNNKNMLRATPPYALRFEYEGEANDPKNIQSVWIKVDAYTTQRELTAAFKEAKKMLPTTPKKLSYPYLNRALRAKELRQSGNKWSEVTRLINEEFHSNYEENYVVKMVKRLESHL